MDSFKRPLAMQGAVDLLTVRFLHSRAIHNDVPAHTEPVRSGWS